MFDWSSKALLSSAISFACKESLLSSATIRKTRIPRESLRNLYLFRRRASAIGLKMTFHLSEFAKASHARPTRQTTMIKTKRRPPVVFRHSHWTASHSSFMRDYHRTKRNKPFLSISCHVGTEMCGHSSCDKRTILQTANGD